MGIYIFVFMTSCFLLYIGDGVRNRFISKCCVLVSILLPSLLAGLRADSIGTDVTIYGISFFERAINSSSVLEFINKQILLGHSDIGFNILVYISSIFSKDYHFGLFLFELITITLIYLGMKKCKKRYDTPVWLGMLLYYLCLYNASMNIMRQNIAVAIAFYAFTYVWDKKYKEYIALMIMAFLVHSSAIVGIVPFLMYIFMQKVSESSERKQLFRGMIFLLAVFIVIAGSSRIVETLVNMGIFRANYLNYLQGGSYSTVTEGRSVSIAALFFQLIYLAIYFLHYRMLNKRSMNSLFFTMTSVMVLLTSCFGPLFAEYISRLSYYFIPLQMVGLANTSLLYKKKSQPIWIALIIALVFATWMRTYVILGYHDTVPYQFYWNN